MRLNDQVDVRLKRRPLTAEELRKVIDKARNAEDVLGVPGPGRAAIYVVAAETGLRRSEIRTLKRGSFDLEGTPPSVTVTAAYAKGKREDVLPLRPLTAKMLKEFFTRNPALSDTPAFPHMPKARKGGKLLAKDLEAAEVSKGNAQTGLVDFHAPRKRPAARKRFS